MSARSERRNVLVHFVDGSERTFHNEVPEGWSRFNVLEFWSDNGNDVIQVLVRNIVWLVDIEE